MYCIRLGNLLTMYTLMLVLPSSFHPSAFPSETAPVEAPKSIKFGLESMLRADFTSAAILISFGAVIGKSIDRRVILEQDPEEQKLLQHRRRFLLAWLRPSFSHQNIDVLSNFKRTKTVIKNALQKANSESQRENNSLFFYVFL